MNIVILKLYDFSGFFFLFIYLFIFVFFFVVVFSLSNNTAYDFMKQTGLSTIVWCVCVFFCFNLICYSLFISEAVLSFKDSMIIVSFTW